VSAFAALAEPSRRRILDALRDGGSSAELSVNELVALVGISQPAVSKHLKVLRDAGLVDVRVDAQHRRYRIRPDGLAEIEHWLQPYRRMWATRLDALEQHLDRLAQTPPINRNEDVP
jgi:DNA-binding transcriptional ArsR family regulator